MIVTDLALINHIENHLHAHFILLVHTTTLYLIVVPINVTLVLEKAPLVIITHLLDDINHHIVHPLHHLLIVIEVDHTQLLKHTN